MTDVYGNPTADEITQHMTACGHAVDQIDGIKAGTDYIVLLMVLHKQKLMIV